MGREPRPETCDREPLVGAVLIKLRNDSLRTNPNVDSDWLRLNDVPDCPWGENQRQIGLKTDAWPSFSFKAGAREVHLRIFPAG